MKKKLIILLALLVVTFVFANEVEMEQSVNDVDLNNTSHYTGSFSEEVWDLQFSYDVDTPSGLTGISGAETDGTYLYGTKWSGTGEIVKFDLQGNYIETFTIPGVVNLRDLAYDGQYFYGSDASNYIWEMDFTNHTLISTITTPSAVRSIAYDSDLDAFWYNNFSTDLVLVDRNGTQLNTIAAPPSLYGCAYDNFTPDGPYLWIFTGTSTGGGCQIEQYDLNTLTLTGETHSVDGDLGAGAYIAGGLFLEPNLVPGKITLGGLAQGTPDLIYGYEIGVAADPDAPGEPTDVAVIPDAGGALEALITWVCPSVTVGGDPLTDLTEMQVWRDDALIYTDTNPSIGGTGTYNDVSVPASAIYTYTVVGVNTAGEGLSAIASSWIGEDVPAAVENLTPVQTTPGMLDVTVSWDNPTTGLNGGPFNNPILGYHIVEYPGATINEITGITTSWNTTVTGSGTYWWEVIPYNMTGDGGVAVTDPLFLAGPGLFVEDFEGSNGGYSSAGTNDCWEWGTPNYPEGPATAHSGTNCWGTALTGPFLNDSQCHLQTVPITLPTGNAFFSFYHWYDFGPSNWDGGNLKVSDDGGTTWVLVYPDGGYPSDELATSNPLYPEPGYCGEPGLGWVEASFDLTDYAGEEVLIKFDFGSSSVVEHPGWYIDDVMYEIAGGDPGTIEGTVTLDGGTGNVEDVEVTAGGVTVNPDSNGDYVISINSGTYDVTASLADYIDDTASDIVVNEGVATTGVDLTLVYDAPTLEPPSNLAVDADTGLFTWDAPGGGGAGSFADGFESGDLSAWDDFIQGPGVPGDTGFAYWYSTNSPDGTPPEGVYAAQCDWGYTIDTWIMSPAINATVNSNVTFQWYGSYYWSVDPNDNSDLFVKVSADGGTTWDMIWTYGDIGVWDNFTWYETTLSLSDYADQTIQVAFNLVGDDNAVNCLDDVTIGDDALAFIGTHRISESSVAAIDAKKTDGTSITMIARELQSYNVYLNGTLQGNTSDTEWQLTNIPDGDNTAGVEAVYDEGVSVLVTIDFSWTDADNNLVVATELTGNYPNPFNPSTTIAFNLANAGHVTIDVYNIKGEKVVTLVDGDYTAASHTATWNGRDDNNKQVSSGVYFYKMKADKFVQTKKMILMK